MTVAIVEPNPGGHRFQAVAHVARLALRTSEVLVLTSQGAGEREEFDAYLADLPVTLRTPFDSNAPGARSIARVIRDACAAGNVQQVVVMEADDALKTWWYVGRRALRGLPQRPRIAFFLTRWPASLERGGIGDPYYLKVRAAKTLLVALARMTRTLDRCAGFAGRDEPKAGWLVKSARDPASCLAHSRDRAALREELGLAQHRRLVGIFGGVSVRKNPQLALEAVLAVSAEADLLLAGPLDDDTRTWLDGLSPRDLARIIVRDGFLSNESLDKHLAASDVVLLLMRLEGPSGIMGKALSADVPVVTAGSKTRARELVALHRGAAVEYTPVAVAEGLRASFDASPSPSERGDLPTGDAFAMTILGTRGDGYSVSGRAEVKTWVIRRWAGARNLIRSRAVAVVVRPRAREPFVRLGSEYGGWWLPARLVRPGAVAYLGGAGEDISFDLVLHDRGCIVRTLDPTPRAIAHVRAHAPDSDRFVFVPVGLWDAEDDLEFFAPTDPSFVSHSAVNLFGTSASFVAHVKPIRQVMAELGDVEADIVKLDIEGAEHRVLEDMTRHGPHPSVICVEFDQPQRLRRIIERVRALKAAGYRLAKVEEWNYTFVQHRADAREGLH